MVEDDLQEFLKEIEKIFKVIRDNETEEVELAAYQHKGVSYHDIITGRRFTMRMLSLLFGKTGLRLFFYHFFY